MASAKGIRAGAAYVELYAEDNRLARGLRLAQQRLKTFSSSVRQVGKEFAKIGAVFALPIVGGAKVFADFEEQLAGVATLLDDPDAQLETFREGLRRLAVEVGESTGSLTKALVGILSAAIPADQALGVLTVAAKAAKAGFTDTATAAGAITGVLRAYGLAADRAADVSDLLATMARRGKLSFAELAPSIGSVAKVAATAGVSLEEMGAAIALFGRQGLKTEEAVAALQGILAAFTRPTAEGAALARELGFELGAATLKAEGLAGVLARVGKLPSTALAHLFPDLEALQGPLPLQGFAADLEAIQSRAGTTETAYDRLAGTLGHAFAQVKQSVLAVLSVIGEVLAGPMAKMAETVQRYLGIVQAWIARNRDLVVTGVKVAAVVGLATAALVPLGAAGMALSYAFGGLAAIVGLVGTVFTALGAILALLCHKLTLL